MTCLLLCYALSLRLPVLVGCHLLLISGSFQGNVQRQHAAAAGTWCLWGQGCGRSWEDSRGQQAGGRLCLPLSLHCSVAGKQRAGSLREVYKVGKTLGTGGESGAAGM